MNYFTGPVPVQPATIDDLDRRVIRHALWEVIGLVGIALIVLFLFLRFFGFSFQRLIEGFFIVALLGIGAISASFIWKEPAIERIAKALIVRFQTARERAAAEPEHGSLAVASTNQANQDYNTALLILKASLEAVAVEKDGEKLKGKPWSERRCRAAGFTNKWDDWARVMELWRRAGIAKDPTGRKATLVVTSLQEGGEKLDALMVREGFRRLRANGRGEWIRA